MNWLDFVLIIIIILTTVMGVVRGLARQVIGLVAVVAGLVLAALYYEGAAGLFETFVGNRLLSNFLGFLLVFFAVLVAGGILGHLITKAMKGPLALANRLFGGAFGFIKAVLVCGILVFALVTFGVAKPALRTSALAPASLAVTRAAIQLIPQDLRDEFTASYKKIRESGGKHGQKI